ncbi:MAG: hypothetical protein ACM4AI_23145 [Acidobacteriota bacterium]
MRDRLTSRLTSLLVVAILTGWIAAARADLRPASQSTFAAQIAALSEPGGYFDTDNLISNERSYLHVLPALQRANVRGGAYIGVGPDQNFSYIAAIQPSIAIIVDIRRDNLLLHLLFKSLFAESRSRVEFLALLFGRPVPDSPAWEKRSLQELVKYVDDAKSLDRPATEARRTRITARLKSFGVPLSPEDLQTVDRFHRRFTDAGLGLQFESTGRPPQVYNPTYRDLLLETDGSGRAGHYLATEDAFQFLKTLEARDLLIPVVGDFAGPKALAAVGRFLKDRNERVSAFYASNVEFYLFRNGTFPRFVANLGLLPRSSGAMVIRSVFSGGRPMPGYASASVTQPLAELLDGYAQGRFRQYWELTGR